MAEPRGERAPDIAANQRRIFLLRLGFLSLGIWSICTLLCGIILSAICLQKGEASYSVLAVVLTSLGMTGIITSLPCCLYLSLFYPRQNPSYENDNTTSNSPSFVSDLFVHLSNDSNEDYVEDAPARHNFFSGPVVFGFFRPLSRNVSPRQTPTVQPPPPYDPPPCYEVAVTLRPLSSATTATLSDMNSTSDSSQNSG